ncbi:MAG: hypothetical protein AAB926_01685 [Patescibacteria group bacterium]
MFFDCFGSALSKISRNLEKVINSFPEKDREQVLFFYNFFDTTEVFLNPLTIALIGGVVTWSFYFVLFLTGHLWINKSLFLLPVPVVVLMLTGVVLRRKKINGLREKLESNPEILRLLLELKNRDLSGVIVQLYSLLSRKNKKGL